MSGGLLFPAAWLSACVSKSVRVGLLSLHEFVCVFANTQGDTAEHIVAYRSPDKQWQEAAPKSLAGKKMIHKQTVITTWPQDPLAFNYTVMWRRMVLAQNQVFQDSRSMLYIGNISRTLPLAPFLPKHGFIFSLITPHQPMSKQRGIFMLIYGLWGIEQNISVWDQRDGGKTYMWPGDGAWGSQRQNSQLGN